MVNVELFGKRLRALQEQGLEVEVIGRGGRLLDLQRKLALGRFVKRLLLTNRGKQVSISLVQAPQMQGDRMSFALALQIPAEGTGAPLSKADRSRLNAFIAKVIEDGSRASKARSNGSRHPSRQLRRRASSGM
jgi:hypothetical protein